MTTHSYILVWRIPPTEEPGKLHSPWVAKSQDTTERLSLSLFIPFFPIPHICFNM